MPSIKTILDTRRAKSDGAFNVIFRITHLRKVYTINSGVSVQQLFWNNRRSEIEKSHPNAKLLNIKLSKFYYKIQQDILQLDDEFTIEKLRHSLGGKTKDISSDTFKVFSEKLIQQMIEANRTGNAIVYQTAVNRLISFHGRDLHFTDINYKLLDSFNHYLLISGLKQNSVSNYFRSIRAIYNKAIKSKVVDRAYYPFHDFSIKSEKTAKRAILKEDILKLTQVSLEEHSTAKKSLDYFLLSFYLRGISFTDIAYLKQTDINDNRVLYKRRKTHKNYSVKLFPKALEIIKQFNIPNNKYLLPIIPFDVPEDSIKAKKIIQQWIKTTNKYLKRLSIDAGLSSNVTTYVSRHSFATIAKKLGYSNELIAEALGHEYGNKITNIYLDAFDTDVLDDMHNKIITF